MFAFNTKSTSGGQLLVLLQSKGIPNPSGPELLMFENAGKIWKAAGTYLHRHLRKGMFHSLWLIHMSSAAVTYNFFKKKLLGCDLL